MAAMTAAPAATWMGQLEQARVAQQQGRLAQAQALCDAVLAKWPDRAEAWCQAGTLALARGDSVQAQQACARAVALAPNLAPGHLGLAKAWHAQQAHGAALACLDRALVIDASVLDAWFERGLLLQKLGRQEEALFSYERALQLDPGCVAAHANRGNVLSDMGRTEAALKAYQRALELAPQSVVALVNHGATLLKLGRGEEALDSFAAALRLQPDHADAWANQGNVQFQLGQDQAALASYTWAQAIDPGHVGARFNESLCRLLQGDLAKGWQQYEWRWHTRQLRGARRQLGRPLWLGQMPLQGKTILLHAEQGLGDTIQFCRYVGWVAALGARVLLEVQAPLKGLLAQLPGISQIFARGEPLPDFDCHCPLMSLPLAHRSTLDNLPAASSYLAAEPDWLARWAQRLGPTPGLRIGFACSGSAGHVDDSKRSLPLAQLLAALPPQAAAICLQKEMRAADRIALGQARFLGDQLHDFHDTAALVALMDLVVTVDTAVAHLAAALGKPVWIVLPYTPDWRWLRERPDSPWYPTVRLLRQPAPGDWETVLRQLGEVLGKQCGFERGRATA